MLTCLAACADASALIYIVCVASSRFVVSGGTVNVPWPHFSALSRLSTCCARLTVAVVMHCIYRFMEYMILVFGFLFVESHTFRRGFLVGTSAPAGLGCDGADC